jgi:hypothetical protein
MLLRFAAYHHGNGATHTNAMQATGKPQYESGYQH